MAFLVRRKPCWCSCKNFRTILWKAYNIHSLTVGETEDPTMSRMTICIDADEKTFEQVKKQLNRSVEVIKVIDYTDTSIRTKEIMFIKVKSLTEKQMAEIFQMAEVFRFQGYGKRQLINRSNSYRDKE
mgnify:CR=1 FL=1